MEVDLPPAKNPASDFIKLPPGGWGCMGSFMEWRAMSPTFRTDPSLFE